MFWFVSLKWTLAVISVFDFFVIFPPQNKWTKIPGCWIATLLDRTTGWFTLKSRPLYYIRVGSYQVCVCVCVCMLCMFYCIHAISANWVMFVLQNSSKEFHSSVSKETKSQSWGVSNTFILSSNSAKFSLSVLCMPWHACLCVEGPDGWTVWVACLCVVRQMLSSFMQIIFFLARLLIIDCSYVLLRIRIIMKCFSAAPFPPSINELTGSFKSYNLKRSTNSRYN